MINRKWHVILKNKWEIMFEFKRSVIINGKCFTLHRCVMINEKCQFEKKCDENGNEISV